jgi:hypothetical protein
MGLFGKDIMKKKGSKELYDFAQHGLLGGGSGILIDDLMIQVDETSEETAARKKREAAKKKPNITPKQLYNLQSLNLTDFVLDCDPDYIDEQANLLVRKAKLIINDDLAKIRYGKKEIESLIVRMKNRESYADHKEFFEEFPYTSSNQITSVLDGHKNLRTRRVEEFIPDLPAEAIDVMERYNSHCKQICDKQAVFYIIADEKDFKVQSKKRDPVLLAQSPFGLVWQILGAWDEEMMLLDEL